MTRLSDQTERLTAESDIRACLLRYARGVDRLDMDLVRACYHPDATDSHGSVSGPVDEFVPWVERVLKRYDLTMHFLGNPLVEFTDAEHARVETYGMAMHRSAGGADRLNLVTGFRYLDRFDRRNNEWRIATRVAVTEWSRVDREVDWWPIPDAVLQGRRDRTDPVYDV